jgi:uncharacterized membrane protein
LPFFWFAVLIRIWLCTGAPKTNEDGEVSEGSASSEDDEEGQAEPWKTEGDEQDD